MLKPLANNFNDMFSSLVDAEAVGLVVDCLAVGFSFVVLLFLATVVFLVVGAKEVFLVVCAEVRVCGVTEVEGLVLVVVGDAACEYRDVR